MGARSFQPASEIFNRIQEVGQEFGATTGRVRQCNWINVKEVQRAISMNGVNRLVVNKVDILREVGSWGTTEAYVENESAFRSFLQEQFSARLGIDKIYFSDNPRTISDEKGLTEAA